VLSEKLKKLEAEINNNKTKIKLQQFVKKKPKQQQRTFEIQRQAI